MEPGLIERRCAELATQGVRLFLAAAPHDLGAFELTPFGVPVTPVPFARADTQVWSTDTFLRLFNQMNAYAFGPRGLPMPTWVLVDHALLSSGVLLAAVDRDRLTGLADTYAMSSADRHVLELLESQADEADYAGPIPVAGYCAAPTADRRRWTGWSMCSVIPRAGLAFIVKALAMAAYGTETLGGVTQYDNLALRTHTRFGPARIEAATLGLHTAAASLVYSTDIRAWRQGTADHAPLPEPTWLLEPLDTAMHAKMQGMLDAGTHALTILPPGIVTHEGSLRVPVLATPIDT